MSFAHAILEQNPGPLGSPARHVSSAGLQLYSSVTLTNTDRSSAGGACVQMIRLLAVGRLQGVSGMGTVPTSPWAVEANGSAHTAITNVDAAIEGMANALALFLEG
ncbi:hypothetical protein [Mycobacterium sp.]|uniref:hypothetical protein n=1 Tax=Mycobacterium sp. TaxID=1785 RepID=UPI003C74B941